MIRRTAPAAALALVLLLAACSSGGNYEDGVYFGTYSHVDSHGWKPQLEITVEDGEILSANFDYVNPDGELKTEDEAYAERMTSITGRPMTPAEASKQLEERLLEEQSGSVDAVSGATSSSEWFNNLSVALQEKAEEGDTSRLVLPMNDTYTAEVPEPDERGYTQAISITFEGGDIVDVTYTDTDADGNGKRESEYVNTEMEKQAGISWKDAVEQLETQLEETQSVEQVDAVTGATGASETFKELAREAIEKRR